MYFCTFPDTKILTLIYTFITFSHADVNSKFINII